MKDMKDMNVQERIARINKLREELENHCMCAEFIDRGNVYVVIYPPGYTNYQGIQHNLDKGKIHALEQLIKRCEDDWQESMFWKN